MVVLTALGVEVPVPAGFVRDRGAAGTATTGGLLVRLVREHAVAGSPRIEITAQPRRELPTSLEEFLQQNLDEMSALEKSGAIHIGELQRSSVSVGPRRGYRVRYQYVLSAAQVSVTQISTLLVIDGRGVAVTAAGRTELFTPLASVIDTALTGLRTPLPAPQTPPSTSESLTQPVDLNKALR